ncbi:trypsin-like serine peptidase [Stackebrandtia nassauensis]|uniref:PKD repeat-containing protein n=1 Tax=Stackebrandtia nassauensis (strain DSM 44728 / CIP 108903 / NRRL B-16338 / NBRC 102104 / LLR-40K-21) TaxID=446470 RepID=D3QBE9_STANL|nr:serine protease [Stackebrandtia nassauensis]ADD42831.1 PKD repeat-containing protein [Stackebrandtia nassauensis DSM 44728]
MRAKHLLAVAAATIAAAGALAVASGTATAESQQADPAALPEPSVEKVGEHVDDPTKLSYKDSDGAVTVSHPGATYVKVNFTSLDLAPGDSLTVSAPGGTEKHTYHGAPGDGLRKTDAGYTRHGDSGFAALSVEGDTAKVTLHRSSGSTAKGAVIEGYWRGYDTKEYAKANADTRSVCDNDARRDVTCYAESRPTEYANAKPVARLLMGGSACTAFRVGNTNRLLTNNHCMSDQGTVASSETQFGYECATCGGNDPAEPTKVGGETMVSTDAGLDYTLYSVQNFDSISSFGTLYVEEREPSAGERIYIPGHGDASPKRLSIFEEEDNGTECSIQEPNLDSTNAGYMCDTSGGNSGSPVIAGDTNKVIALHHLGGCHNAGTRMALIFPEISGDIDNNA